MNAITGDKFTRSEESILWVQQQVDGLTLAEPCKRSRVSAACLITSIEHGMAILVLVDEGLYGSALALVRLQFEAYVRGTWMAQCASNNEVDKAGQDEFPKIAGMIAALEKPGLLDNALLSKIKHDAWEPLNSLTHTGYQQIGPRLTKDGIGPCFDDNQIQVALNWASARARDFYDIHLIASMTAMSFNSIENLELVRHIFAAKEVPLGLLGKIEEQREFHRPDWDSVKTSSNDEELAEFDTYFDFVVEKANSMKALWKE
jgi:hypothetical protein